MRSVENAECRNKKKFFHFNFPFLILVMSMENEACVIWKVTNDL